MAYASDVAFTPAVKAIQARKGSRDNYARMEEGEGWSTTITPALAAFIAEQNSIYVGTANAAGQPYIQHRGGPPGFLRVVDETTLAFVDFKGNRQYISQGNLAENPRAFIFLMDYTRRRRIKLWGKAWFVEGDAALVQSLTAAHQEVFMFSCRRGTRIVPSTSRSGSTWRDGSRDRGQGPDDPRTHGAGCRADAPVAA